MAASSSVIGALRVDLSAGTIEFAKDLAKASALLTAFSASVTKQMAAVRTALIAALGPGAVGLAVKSAIDLAAHMDDLSQSLGVSTEKLSGLKYAAEQSGGSLDLLVASLGRLNRNLGEVAAGGANAASRALEAMGIEARDSNGQIRGQVDIVLDVAEKFSAYEDGANKASLAVALFGKQGADLIPLLNKGRDGIIDLTQEAQRLGVVIDSQTARAAADFNDQIDRLGSQLQGISLSIARELLPELNHIAEVLSKELADVAASSSEWDQYREILRFVVVTASALVLGLKSLVDMVITVAEVVGHAFSGEFSKASKAMTDFGLRTGEAVVDFWNFAHEIGEAVDEVVPKLLTLGEPIKEFNLHIREKPPGIGEEEKAAEDLAQTMEMVRRVRSEALDDFLNTDTAPFEQKFAAIQTALQNGTIDVREFGQRWKEVNEQQAAQIQGLATAVSGALTTIFEDNKAAAIASAIINTLVGITQALRAGPPPWNLAQAAVVAATGFAQVAKIRSTSKASTSGSSTISAAGTAGVAADVAQNDDGGGGSDQTVRPSRTINVTLVGNTFNRQQVRELIESFNEAIADGARLYVSPT